MSCSPKMSPNTPSESNSRLRPTMPSSGSARNSPSPPRQISPPPSPALLPAARSPAPSCLSPLSPRSRSLSSPLPRPPDPPSHPPIRYLPPAQSAPPHNSQSSLRLFQSPLVPFRPLPPLILLLAHPTPAAIVASHRKSSRRRQIAVSRHRSTRKPARAPPPIPPPRETPAPRAAGEIAQCPPDSFSPSPHPPHSPAPPHLFPAAAAPSAPSPPPRITRLRSSPPLQLAFSYSPPAAPRILPSCAYTSHFYLAQLCAFVATGRLNRKFRLNR